eukprot:s72_g18.t1
MPVSGPLEGLDSRSPRFTEAAVESPGDAAQRSEEKERLQGILDEMQELLTVMCNYTPEEVKDMAWRRRRIPMSNSLRKPGKESAQIGPEIAQGPIELESPEIDGFWTPCHVSVFA